MLAALAVPAIDPSPKLRLVVVSPPSHSLPFVRVTDKVDFWAPARTGQYETDCALGRVYAQDLLAHMAEHHDQVIFGSIVRAIAEGGVYGGTEIGFCARLGFALCGFIGGR